MDIWLYSQQPYNSGIACMEQMCVCLDPFSAMFVSIVVSQLLAGVIVYTDRVQQRRQLGAADILEAVLARLE